MNREELIQLRDAIDMTLALPDSVRALLAQWLAPEAKGNGLDPRPGPAAATTPPRQAKVRRPAAFAMKTAEQRLLRAMQDNPGMTVNALANAAGSSRSATGERLRQLAERGVVEKDLAGRWKLKGGEPRPLAQEAAPPDPTVAPSS